MEFIPNNLPLDIDIETKAILKKSILANNPNPDIKIEPIKVT